MPVRGNAIIGASKCVPLRPRHGMRNSLVRGAVAVMQGQIESPIPASEVPEEIGTSTLSRLRGWRS